MNDNEESNEYEESNDDQWRKWYYEDMLMKTMIVVWIMTNMTDNNDNDQWILLMTMNDRQILNEESNDNDINNEWQLTDSNDQ